LVLPRFSLKHDQNQRSKNYKVRNTNAFPLIFVIFIVGIHFQEILKAHQDNENM